MKLNLHFLIIFIVACIAFITDIVIYVCKVNYCVGLLISTFFCITILLVFRYKKKIEITLDFDKTDIFLWLMFIILIIAKCSVYPDYIYDVLSYHLYLQENPFIDKVNFDFFPGRIYCVFLFPLGDRMHYIFRYIFGLRFGTILSYYAPIVLFYQTKRILSFFTNDSRKSKTFAYIIFLIFIYTDFIGTYQIDNLGIVFLLEIFYIVFSNPLLFINKFVLYVVALLCGIAISIKITNVFFIVIVIRIFDNKRYRKI